MGAGAFIGFCCRGDAGAVLPSALTCANRGDVCGIGPGMESDIVYGAGYPEAAWVAMAAACDGDMLYCGCMPYAGL